MKRRHLILCLFAALTGLQLAGCGEAPPPEAPNHLFAEFFVRYLQAEGQIKAHASFFEGDSIQSAVPKAFAGGVAFQGIGMNVRNLPGGTIRYTFEERGEYADTFLFRFQDGLGQNREAALSMAPIDSFAVAGGQASRSTGMSLYASGGKLSPEERMVLFFSDADNKASTIMLSGPSAGDTYRIPAAKVETLRPGGHTLYLVKKKKTAIKGDTLSRVADIEYYTNTIDIEVVE